MPFKFSPVTQGRQIKSLETGGFLITETYHPARLELGRHAHEAPSIAFVLSGSFVEIFHSRSLQCEPLQLLFKPAGEMHSDSYGSEGARSLIIEVGSSRSAMIAQFSPILNSVAHIGKGRITSLALQLYREFQMMEVAAPLAIEALVLEMLAEACRGSENYRKNIPGWLSQVRELIESRFSEAFTLGDLSREVGVHPAHIARTFRKHFQCSIGQFVRRLRLDSAVTQLSETDLPLSEVALRAGFYDQSHFNRAFKSALKMTPTEYRGRLRSHKVLTKRS